MRRHLARRQPGQVVVVAALGMLALIAALALVVDIGLLWESQRELQKTADSAALAGVILLPDDAAGSIDRAQTYASVNLGIAAAFCAEPPTTTATPGQHTLIGGGTVYTLTVTMQCTAGFHFGQAVNDCAQTATDTPGICTRDGTGFNLSTIPNTVDDCQCLRASATAVIGSLREANCPAPFAVTDANQGVTENGTPIFDGDAGATWLDMARNGSGYTFGELVALHVDTAAASYGNFHAVQFGQSGGQAYESFLAGQCQVSLGLEAGDDLSTEPGDMTGPTEHGLSDRGLVDCSGGGQPDLCNTSYPESHPDFAAACPDDPFDHNGRTGVLNPDGSVKGSSRCFATVVVVMPLAYVDAQGRTLITVEGFATFFVAGWDKSDKQVWGMFVSHAPSLGEVGAYNPLGTIVTRLIR